MIANDEQLAVVKEQAACLERAIESLARTVRPKSEQQFKVFAEGYVDQLQILREEIEAYLGIAAVKRAEPEVEVSVDDENAGLGETRLSAVTKLADHFRRALRTTVEAVRDQLSASDRENVTAEFVNRLCDPPLQAVLPGSVRVQLGSPHVEVGHDLYSKGLQLLSLAIRAASNDVKASAELQDLPSDQQRAAWNAVKLLAPEEGDLVEKIGFGGHFVGQPQHIQFNTKTRVRILKRLREIGNQLLTMTERGVIDEIDFGRRLFTLREPETRATIARCKYVTAQDSEVDRLRRSNVEVVGTRRSNALRTTPLQVKTIRALAEGE
jgi:hypothetical protein